jgi:DNA polymerase-3 subunit beta
MNAINPVTRTEFLESLAAISLADVLRHFDVRFPANAEPETTVAPVPPALPESPPDLAESTDHEASDPDASEVDAPETAGNVVASPEVTNAPELSADHEPDAPPSVVTTLRMTCDRQALAKATAAALKAVEKRNAIPVLSNVLIEADGTGNIIVEGTDLDMSVRVTVPAEVDPDFAITVPAHRLHDLLRKAGPGEVSFTVEKTTFHRSTDPATQRAEAEAVGYSVHEVSGQWKARLPNGNYLAPVKTEEAAWQKAYSDQTSANYGPAVLTLGSYIKTTLQTVSPADYPHLKAGEFPVAFNMPAVQLADAIKAVEFAVSTEETRYYLNGVYVHTYTRLGAPILRMVATDGHRLAQFDLPGLTLPSGVPGAIVPRKMVAVALALFGSKPPKAKKGEPAPEPASIKVEVSDSKVRISCGATVITSKLIDGTFPDYQRVIPAGNDKVLVANAEELAGAVARVTTVSSERGRAVRFSLSDDRLVLSVNNPDCGTISEELRVDYQADPIDVGFNSRYLLDIISGRKGAIIFRLADPGSPMLIEPSDDKRATYVLMPMRV